MTGQYDILVADDEDAILEFIIQVLVDEGYAVRAVRDGASALFEVQMAPPGLVLLDNAMPVMTGAETLTRIRELGYYDLPIIVMSANAHARELLGLGATAFLPKPFTLDHLLSLVSYYLPP
ncbi:MAG: hypothetical protein OHK0022_45620 [Roseiflexaceae bacterium]